MFSTWSGSGTGRSDPILEARQLAGTGSQVSSDETDSVSSDSSESSDSDDSTDEGIIGHSRHPFWSNLLLNRSSGSGMTNDLNEIEEDTFARLKSPRNTTTAIANATLSSSETKKSQEIAIPDSSKKREQIPQRKRKQKVEKSAEKLYENTEKKRREGIHSTPTNSATRRGKNINQKPVRDNQGAVKHSQDINDNRSHYHSKNYKLPDYSRKEKRSTKDRVQNPSRFLSNYSGGSSDSTNKIYPKKPTTGSGKIASDKKYARSSKNNATDDQVTPKLSKKSNERKSQHRFASDESNFSRDSSRPGRAEATKKLTNKEPRTFRDDISYYSRASRHSMKSNVSIKLEKKQHACLASRESQKSHNPEDSSQSTKNNLSKRTPKAKLQKMQPSLSIKPSHSSEHVKDSAVVIASCETNNNANSTLSTKDEKRSTIDDTSRSVKDHLSGNLSHSDEKLVTTKVARGAESHSSDVSHRSDTNRYPESTDEKLHQVDTHGIRILTRVESKLSHGSDESSAQELENVEVQILPSDQSHISDLSSPPTRKNGDRNGNNGTHTLTREDNCNSQSSTKTDDSEQSNTSTKEEYISPGSHQSRSCSEDSTSELNQSRSRSSTSASQNDDKRSRSDISSSSSFSQSRSRSEISFSSALHQSRSRSGTIDWQKEVHQILENEAEEEHSDDDLSTDWVKIAREIELKDKRQREKEKLRLAQQHQKENEELERKNLADEELRKLEEKEWKRLGSELGHVVAGAEGALALTVGSALVCQEKTLGSHSNAQRSAQIEKGSANIDDNSDWQKIGLQVGSIWSRLKSNSNWNPFAWVLGSVLVVSTCGGCGYMFDSNRSDDLENAIQQQIRASAVKRKIEAPAIKNVANNRGSTKKKSGLRRIFGRYKEIRGRNQYEYVDSTFVDNGGTNDFRDDTNVDERRKEYHRETRQYDAEIRNDRHERRDKRNERQEYQVVPYVNKDLIVECVKDHLACVDDTELKNIRKRGQEELPKKVYSREEAPLEMYIPRYQERQPPMRMSKRKKRKKKRMGARRLFFRRARR